MSAILQSKVLMCQIGVRGPTIWGACVLVTNRPDSRAAWREAGVAEGSRSSVCRGWDLCLLVFHLPSLKGGN